MSALNWRLVPPIGCSRRWTVLCLCSNRRWGGGNCLHPSHGDSREDAFAAHDRHVYVAHDEENA